MARRKPAEAGVLILSLSKDEDTEPHTSSLDKLGMRKLSMRLNFCEATFAALLRDGSLHSPP